MTSAGRSSSARLAHVGKSVGRWHELFEDGEVAFLGIVLDGVERGEALTPDRRRRVETAPAWPRSRPARRDWGEAA
jgi:hypothetical protein